MAIWMWFIRWFNQRSLTNSITKNSIFCLFSQWKCMYIYTWNGSIVYPLWTCQRISQHVVWERIEKLLLMAHLKIITKHLYRLWLQPIKKVKTINFFQFCVISSGLSPEKWIHWFLIMTKENVRWFFRLSHFQ